MLAPFRSIGTTTPVQLRTIFCTLALVSAFWAAPVQANQRHPNLERGFKPDRLYQFHGIDNVNLFNGNLSVTIPIGPEYPVGDGFSYRFTLVYNSRIWDWELLGPEGGKQFSVAKATDRSNAGLGWRLSLGQLLDPNKEPEENDWVYIGPDGAEHVFFDELHKGVAAGPEMYTQDGSYLRKKSYQGGYRHTVEFPNGEVHTFERRFGGDTSPVLVRMEDRFGNFVNIEYPKGNETQWRIQDKHGRVHMVNLSWERVDRDTVAMVDSLDLQGFDGGRYFWFLPRFDKSVKRACFSEHQDAGLPWPSHPRLPMLDAVYGPEDQTWDPLYHTDADVSTGCRQGALASLTLPTLGRLEYTYRLWDLPAPCRDPNQVNHLLDKPRFSSEQTGVKTRKFVKRNGAVEGTWTYSSDLEWFQGTGNETCAGQDFSKAEVLKTTVISPLKDKTVHHFSVWEAIDDSAKGFRREEYALPIRKDRTDASGTRYLSTEVFDCNKGNGNCPDTPVRSTFARWEWEACGPTGQCGQRRVKSTRTVFHDDFDRYADVDHFRFDGFGHYRKTVTGGNYSTANVRTTTTEYFWGRPNLEVDGNGRVKPGWNMPGPNWTWLLNKYGLKTDSLAGDARRERFCFGNSGFLKRKRIFKNKNVEGPNDVLVVYARFPTLTGSRIEEKYYGGDNQNLGVGTNLCELPLPPDPEYWIKHKSKYGSHEKTEYLEADGKTVFFRPARNEIDQGTGWISKSYDAAGIQTVYEYDDLGRITAIQPSSGARVDNKYVSAKNSNLARVETTVSSNDGTVRLMKEKYFFGDFGRLVREEVLGKDGLTWSKRHRAYDGVGNPLVVSEWGTESYTDAPKTRYRDYDPFGRVRRIEPPEGPWHEIKFSYYGNRVARRTQKIAMEREPSTGAITERNVMTRERYDRQGRLWDVTEGHIIDGKPGPSPVRTIYGYAIGNQLSSVDVAGQKRTFVYDRLGNLRSEIHPEKSTVYDEYDSRGILRQKTDSTTLGYSYDRAGRLEEVFEVDTDQLLKKWVWATNKMRSRGDWGNGKVRTTIRHNIWQGLDLQVREDYVYRGPGGLPSSRTTTLSGHPAVESTYVQGWEYDDLGQPTAVIYPDCVFDECQSTPRTVTTTYSNGFLASIPGYVPRVEYHPNLMPFQIVHANAVITEIGKDPYNRPRPSSIGTTGSNQNWQSGTYLYDGSGNIKRIGSSWYLYDDRNRLVEGAISTTMSGGELRTVGYTYDNYGNLTSITHRGLTRNTPTSAASNQLTAGGVGYDDHGNVDEINGYRLTIDPFNQPIEADGRGRTVVYLYTVDDERVLAYDLSGVSYRATRDLDGRVLREFTAHDGNGWRHTDYIYGLGNALAVVGPENVKHFHHDHLGTIRQITGRKIAVDDPEDGEHLEYHAYYPYGEEATASSQDGEQMKFTGHERDFNSTTGANPHEDDWDYMHARYYSPLYGRFLSVDPASTSFNPKKSLSWNRYSYVNGNPVKNVDPTGMQGHPFYESFFRARAALRILSRKGLFPKADFKLFPLKDIGLKGVNYIEFDITEPMNNVSNRLGISVEGGGAGFSADLNLDGLVYSVPLVEDAAFLLGPFETRIDGGSHLVTKTRNKLSTGPAVPGVFSLKFVLENADAAISETLLLMMQPTNALIAQDILEQMQQDGNLKKGAQIVMGELIYVQAED